MSTITVNGREYQLEDLTEECKAQVVSIQFVESELRQLQAKSAAMQTARNTYIKTLSQLLEIDTDSDDDEIEIDGLGDSLSFD